MRNKLVVTVVALVVLLALGTVGVAFAQSPDRDGDGISCPMAGGVRGGAGLLHEEMIAALAPRLELRAEELQSRIADGETVWHIARDQGRSDDEITTLMQDARQEALDAAVANGDLTEEQAERMDQMRRNIGSRLGLGRGGRGLGRGAGCGGGRWAQST